VEEPASVAEGDLALVVDDVAADTVVEVEVKPRYQVEPGQPSA
jgi:hypothetical protein